MTSILTVAVAAMFSAGLTMYSGFGLGTLLLPVFALFFPVETAVAATAVVHMANNVLKVSLLGKHADWSIVLRFGIPAILSAFLGASALGLVSGLGAVVSYSIGEISAEVTPVKLVMALLMAGFALFELIPSLRSLRFDRKHLLLGGVLSGFFGGLSGHQGALRSAFLVKSGMSTEAFVGTNAVIGTMVDAARIATYAAVFMASGLLDGGTDGAELIAAGVAGAFAGVLLAQRYLHKVTMHAVQTLTGVLLLLIAAALGSGLI